MMNLGHFFKSGLNSDFTNRDRLIELLRFHSTWAGDETAESEKSENPEWISLKSYTERMPETQKEIYYLSGDNLSELQHDSRLEYFNKKGIEVLLLGDPVDAFVVPAIGSYQEKPPEEHRSF